MEIAETLEAVLRTLDAVEVKGRENLDHMLGAMMGINKILQTLREEQSNGNNKP